MSLTYVQQPREKHNYGKGNCDIQQREVAQNGQKHTEGTGWILVEQVASL
uniref:Uncharacterized protein n=1 Tax=Octopus bimaculoides TaxID=37653 RepID=A0A0L8HC61_OCTBM